MRAGQRAEAGGRGRRYCKVPQPTHIAHNGSWCVRTRQIREKTESIFNYFISSNINRHSIESWSPVMAWSTVDTNKWEKQQEWINSWCQCACQLSIMYISTTLIWMYLKFRIFWDEQLLRKNVNTKIKYSLKTLSYNKVVQKS